MKQPSNRIVFRIRKKYIPGAWKSPAARIHEGGCESPHVFIWWMACLLSSGSGKDNISRMKRKWRETTAGLCSAGLSSHRRVLHHLFSRIEQIGEIANNMVVKWHKRKGNKNGKHLIPGNWKCLWLADCCKWRVDLCSDALMPSETSETVQSVSHSIFLIFLHFFWE